eukprot:4897678-Pleurochrysis_carterae.AAC.1
MARRDPSLETEGDVASVARAGETGATAAAEATLEPASPEAMQKRWAAMEAAECDYEAALLARQQAPHARTNMGGGGRRRLQGRGRGGPSGAAG